MNREFTTTSKLARSVLAVAAVVSTALIVSGIGGLAEHYSADMQLAQAQPVVTARR
jgi:hypothetical protein